MGPKVELIFIYLSLMSHCQEGMLHDDSVGYEHLCKIPFILLMYMCVYMCVQVPWSRRGQQILSGT